MEFVQPIRDKKKINAISKILKASNRRDHCLFILGINSGLRISDLLALKVEDVVDAKRKAKDRIVLREKKTGKSKDFPLPEIAKRAVMDYLSTRSEYSPDEPLFKSRKGNHAIQRDQAYKVINGAAQTVGITEQIGTHTLRKTFGYHAYQNGYPIELIQKLLNHHSPATTLRYIGITQEDMDEVYMNLNLG